MSILVIEAGIVYDNVTSNFQEVKARGVPVIAITDCVYS